MSPKVSVVMLLCNMTLQANMFARARSCAGWKVMRNMPSTSHNECLVIAISVIHSMKA